MTPLISIITPTYNSSEFVEQTIQSILKQTETRWELLLIDDFSIDGTQEILLKYSQQDKRIKSIFLKINSGAAVARNTGIQMSQGKYIAFLDSDDLWTPEKLEKQLHFMQSTQCALSYTGYFTMTEEGRINDIPFTPPTQITYQNLLNTCSIGCLTAMYDTQILGKIDMPLIRKRQDYGLWLKILRLGHIAKGLPEPLAYYRLRKKSVSSNKLLAASYQWIIYRNIEKLSLFKSFKHFIFYFYYGLKKYH